MNTNLRLIIKGAVETACVKVDFYHPAWIIQPKLMITASAHSPAILYFLLPLIFLLTVVNPPADQTKTPLTHLISLALLSYLEYRSRPSRSAR